MNLAKRIRDLRYSKGWGPDELANRAKISRTALYQIERGNTSKPQAGTLAKDLPGAWSAARNPAGFHAGPVGPELRGGACRGRIRLPRHEVVDLIGRCRRTAPTS